MPDGISRVIGSVFAAVDRVLSGLRSAMRGAVRLIVDGPMTQVVIAVLLLITGLGILHERESQRLDRFVGWFERALVVVAMLAMTGLAFNEYLQREAVGLFQRNGWNLPGIWQLDGQMNAALLLMVVVGFVGASIATQERKHIAVDAVDRVLTPRPAAFVKRIVALVAAGLCYLFGQGAWQATFSHSQDAFEGAKVWGWMQQPINMATALVPGEKFGPGTEYPSVGKWEDAMFDQGYEWDQLPAAFSFVEDGDRFPLWLPLLLLSAAFFMMGVRFLAQAIRPPTGKIKTDGNDGNPFLPNFVVRAWATIGGFGITIFAVQRMASGAYIVGLMALALGLAGVVWGSRQLIGRYRDGFIPPSTLGFTRGFINSCAAAVGLLAWTSPDPHQGIVFATLSVAMVASTFLPLYTAATFCAGSVWYMAAQASAGLNPSLLVRFAAVFLDVPVLGTLLTWFQGQNIVVALLAFHLGFAVVVHGLLSLVAAPDLPVVRGTRRAADVVLAGIFPGALIAMALGIYFGQGLLIVLASIMMVLLGAPLFVAVGVGTLAAWSLLREGGSETVVIDMFEATKKQELLAIPFFVLAGNLMTKGSIAARLIDFTKATIGFLPGGLGVGAVMACAFFAAISGSSPVTVIAIGSILFPMLVADGYGEKYSMGLLSTAGGLGIIIPPSIPMIVYAIIVGQNPKVGAIDPATLFKAGILPGLFIASVLIAYTLFLWWPRPGSTTLTRPPNAKDWARNVARTGVRGMPSLFLPVIILGGIYGWFDLSFIGIPISISLTVTEAAAVAVVYALFVELFINRELKWSKVPEIINESAVMMGSLFLILVIAISLNRFFVFEQVPEAATDFMLTYVDSKFTFLIVVNLFLLALGCVMDILSAILIVAPLLAPIAASYGINGVHFGIMFIVNLELGYLTPPLGINLFVASTVFDRPLLKVIRAVVPFLLLMLFCLAVIVWFEPLSTFLLAEGVGDPPMLADPRATQ
jgi:C4-dicarboxylate transporter, DctM subunit